MHISSFLIPLFKVICTPLKEMSLVTSTARSDLHFGPLLYKVAEEFNLNLRRKTELGVYCTQWEYLEKKHG